MPSQHAIEIFALINLVVLGLSLLVQPLAWARTFAWLHREGDAGALAYASTCLLAGSLVVAFHRVWVGLLVLLTLAGWLQVVEGLVFFLSPAIALRMLAIAKDRPGLHRISGVVFLILAAVIAFALAPSF